MTIKKYYNQLVAYRDLLDKRVSQGKISLDKAIRCIDKLNEWHEIALMIDNENKILRKKGEK